jgi:hypothetical protein
MNAAGRRVRLAEVTAGTLGSASAGSGRDGAVAWHTVSTAGIPSRRAPGQRATGTAPLTAPAPPGIRTPGLLFFTKSFVKMK